VIVHDQTGIVPTRAGNQLPIAPAAVINTYMTKDEAWVTVTSATVRSVTNVARLLDEPLDQYDTVEKQHANRLKLDGLLRAWIADRTAEEALATMRSVEVVASRVYTMADIMADATYRERGDIIEIDDPELGPVKMQGVVPKLNRHGGNVWRPGAELGADNELVYREYIGLSEDEYEVLVQDGVI
jgi:crotonobetainyl-CoA:carnitine CoA-transferase CaiB-like acyl-CoA transferase